MPMAQSCFWKQGLPTPIQQVLLCKCQLHTRTCFIFVSLNVEGVQLCVWWVFLYVGFPTVDVEQIGANSCGLRWFLRCSRIWIWKSNIETLKLICYLFPISDLKIWGQRKSWPWPECINSDCNNGVLCGKKKMMVHSLHSRIPFHSLSYCTELYHGFVVFIPSNPKYIYPFPTAGFKSKKQRMGAGPVGMALAEAVSKGVSWYHCLTFFLSITTQHVLFFSLGCHGWLKKVARSQTWTTFSKTPWWKPGNWSWNMQHCFGGMPRVSF